MENEIDFSVCIEIGKEMINQNNWNVYDYKYNKEFLKNLQNDLYSIKRDIIELEKKNENIKNVQNARSKLSSLFLPFTNKKQQNIEHQKYNYNFLTILQLKKEEMLLEDKINKMKMLL